MELLPSWATFFAVMVATVVFAFFLQAVLLRRRGAYKLPPGPKPWPIIGNLNLIGALPHRSIHEISKRHGPIVQLWFGSCPVVVGSSVEMAKLFLKTNDAVFADRPRTAAGKYTAYDCADIVWSPYGAYWRQARKMCVAELFSARRLESLEHIRHEEVRALLRDLHSAGVAGNAVQLGDHLSMATLGVISRMVLGKKYVEKQPAGAETASSPPTTPEEFKWMMDELFLMSGVLNIGDFIPWLGWLDLQGYVRRMKKVNRLMHRFLDRVLDEHDERRRLQGDGFVARDMVDVLLQLADDPNLDVQLTRNGVKGITQNLVTGGADTSAVTVEWAMSEVLKNPAILAKATKELDNVVGSGRLVTESDIPHLPYVDAIMKETMRMHPVAPLLIPRMSREDATVAGYDVPAGTRVLINTWTISRDPSLWDSPEEFRPERFVGSGIDVKGRDFELLPFGTGRRMCPGYSLGLKVIQLALANLLHAFSWNLPDGIAAGELSMEEIFGLTMPRKIPLLAVVKPRLPDHLYAEP
ncbi:dimethylnonatriene synthase-like isoform X2 [Oryza glaberrima]|uniref:Cytochrome P450 n=1 Tax=Oryza glaberrima TaxID=4538 RepID=I1QMF8_ORYGL|nr:dimethylnonatriene synthase-like isoform X2 [Oryza glaberrima]